MSGISVIRVLQYYPSCIDAYTLLNPMFTSDLTIYTNNMFDFVFITSQLYSMFTRRKVV